ncbi:hypothetical protein CTAM01_08295 [Colletotrichum tamarilloi]|uniref:Uncharacterized protein n=1 Tax=Colletotrichum tamarilloi TaxID=1209934 RepID=A0ABQ9R7E2_9PEZI|nr:uncharacterized protein CTAM01_08295 [Colletotrichum tamarilloi]KAK1496657.1 hypothetical protein CTAM01_08295 [Colletotrichum tamarilloi]
MLMFDSPSYVPRQVYPHTTCCYGPYGPYGWPFDDSSSLRDLAIDCMFIRCGGMEEIQRLKDLAPTLKRLRLGGSSGKYRGVTAWDRSTEGSDEKTDPRGYLHEHELLEVLRLECRGELPQFLALHIITKTNTGGMSPEKLVIRRKLEDLGVELKFYEQALRHGVDYAVLEDEGWTVNDKIGGSLDFQFSSKETSSRVFEPREIARYRSYALFENIVWYFICF